MLLDVKERILILNILPKETNYLTLKIIGKLQNELSFTEEEIKEYDFKDEQIDNKIRTTFNLLKNQSKEIEIGEKATDLISEQLKKMDKEKKLTMDYKGLYEKFIKE